MEMIAYCRAMAAFCRQRAQFENEDVAFWHTEAKAWDDLIVEHRNTPGRSSNACAPAVSDPPASNDFPAVPLIAAD
ncbi:MAG: hypothetical protein J0H42_32050 [Rhizobiales bacterium]|nr:hypothetical protein [Hyphomicrobiales bacterium]